jgi:linoleoyl-CoA desaturase
LATKISFKTIEKSDFHSELKRRVNRYFEENKLDTKGTRPFYFKAIFFISTYWICYSIIVWVDIPFLPKLLPFFVMGICIAGIGFNVMHDAAHGAFSNKEWVNSLMGYSLNSIGGNLFTWKIQHNILHHTYTNLYNYDEDLDAGIVVRLSPHAQWRPHHKYQHLYAWFAYSLVHLSWILIKDFKKISHYNGSGLTYQNKAKPAKEVAIIVLTKLIYLFYMVYVPLVYSNLTVGQFFIGFLIMSFTSGVTLSVVFQLAHVVEGTEHPAPDPNGVVENNWAIHQIETTANFSTENPIVTWFTGGLNHQIEHHLFPKICSAHYPAISKIVKEMSDEYGITYLNTPGFGDAVYSHYASLKRLGNPV